MKPQLINFPIAQYEDMYGNKLGDDNAWHAYVREQLDFGGPGDEYDLGGRGE